MHWKQGALAAAVGWSLVAGVWGAAAPGAEHLKLDERIQAVAAVPGEPQVFESAGITRGDIPLRTLESREGLDSPKRRLVLIGGLDGNDRGVDAALGAVEWFKKEAPAAVRQAWTVAAMPCGNPEGWAQLKPTNDSGGKPAVNYPPQDGFFNDRMNVEARYIWRWLAFQAPDLVLDVRGGSRIAWRVPPAWASLGRAVNAQPLVSPDSLAMALSRETPSGLGTVPALTVDARSTDGPAVLQAALKAAASLPRSAMRQAVLKRMARSPLDTAAVLAAKYPQSASITYIPAVAWTGALRLAKLKGDDRLREKVRAAAAPYLSASMPSISGSPDVTKLAGHILFADLAETEGEAAKKLALDAAALYKPEKGDQPARFGRYWTDDMFMTATLLGRAGKLSGEREYHDLAARTLTLYAAKLQRPDGLFIHAPDAPHAWGRGNGFAALGLMEALTYLPQDHPQRGAVLEIYRKQMAALKKVQAPEGTWRQVIDRPESYREVTATAMNLAAMARGVRLGWLDRSALPVVQRAWDGLAARIGEDGSLADVCEGTGAGPTLRYYYERRALFGPDDRGGAMSLLAALEVAEAGR
jgi:unsaturated rhamnogalacturonyl hydrolase